MGGSLFYQSVDRAKYNQVEPNVKRYFPFPVKPMLQADRSFGADGKGKTTWLDAYPCP